MNAVREVARQIDPNLPLTDVSTQIEQVERRFAQEKLFAQAYTLFGGLALLLASIGLFGLMSYSVSRRTNEIGIRMALGAQRQRRASAGDARVDDSRRGRDVRRRRHRASAPAGFVETLLFGLPPHRPALDRRPRSASWSSVSALAGYLPARRASRVDPMVALHYE